MYRLSLLAILLLTLSGCAGTNSQSKIHQDQTLTPRQTVYYKAILRWQDHLSTNDLENFDIPKLDDLRAKIARQGWSNEMVEEIIEEIRQQTSLTMETGDHWDTPREFVAKNLRGDCEDIAIFLLASLKKLDYPGQVRICAVKAQFVEHAMLKVQMPDQTWRVFETVKKTERNVRYAFTPIVEFDDREIFFATI